MTLSDTQIHNLYHREKLSLMRIANIYDCRVREVRAALMRWSLGRADRAIQALQNPNSLGAPTMSCVSPEEIAGIVAVAFGVSREDMKRRCGRGSASWPYIARGAALLLIERHTTAKLPQAMAAIGLEAWGEMYASIKTLKMAVQDQAALYPTLGNLIEQCEDAIDAAHEKHTAEAAKALKAALQKAAPKPQAKREPASLFPKARFGRGGALWALP